MIFTTADRTGIAELQKLAKSSEGKKALEIIDRICLRDEIAYVPGNKFGQTEFRCGIQQAGKLIRNLIEMKIDWEEVARREKNIQEKQNKGEYDYGV